MSTTYTQAELSAKTVKDLKAILSELKLSQDGKKAELVTRILEQQNGSSDSASGAAATATSDKGAASSAGGTATTAAVEEVTAGNATATGGVEAAQSNNTNATQEEKKDTKQEESLPLPAASNKDSEAEKRINRLKRFGNPDDIAKLERAEKFGTQADAVDEKSISRLDSELSNKRQRKDKAAGASTSTSANGGKPVSPQKNGNTKQTQQNGGRPGLNRAKSNGGGKPASGKGGAAKNAPPALSPEEEEKRRKRAERFNAAS